MSLDIDEKTSNDDIFSNPLEAFPEFIDEPVSQEAAADVSAPAPEPEASPKKEEVKKTVMKSNSFTDPLDTIEEVDISSISSTTAELSFDDEAPAVHAEDDATSSFSTKSNLTFGSIDYEDVAVRKTDDLSDIDDSVPEQSTVTEEVSVDDFLSSAGTGTEEVSLDDFLGDSGFSSPAAPAPSSGNVTEEVSLDDFGVDFGGFDASAVDSFVSASRQEKSDIENAPAIEMELEFDDDFVLETKANPEDDIDFDFEALMSGESVDVPQQTSTGDELLDNFDDIFDNIVDESSPAPKTSDNVEFDPSAIEEVSLDDFGISSTQEAAGSTEAISEQKIVYDEVSEFDDLLSSFSDETHVEIAEKQQNRTEKAGPHDYNIIVIMDEDESSAVVQAPVIDTSEDEEDYNISLFKTEEEAEQYRSHDSGKTAESAVFQDDTPAPSAATSESGSASDTFEDISLDDFGVTFTDETPVEKKETPAPATEEKAPETENIFEEEDIPASEEIIEEPDMPAEPELRIEDTPEMPEIPEEEPDFTADTLPEMPDLPDIPFNEEENSTFAPAECEDTAVDDKKIVDMSDNCVYNGDNTEDTSNMTDVNNEEMTDTMNEGLLEKIVSELSVLRNEMQTLRDEVQTLKGGEPIPAPAAQDDDFALPDEPVVEEPAMEEPAAEEPVVEETPAEEPAFDMPAPEAEADPFAAPQEAGGFFSGDDDDETIALSGDELNNILNSADFTHEDGSNFGMEAPEGSILPDGLDEGAGLDAPVEETVAEEPAVEEPAMEEPVFEEDAGLSMDAPVEETVAEEPVAEEPAVEEPAMEEPVFEEDAGLSMDAPVEEPSFDIPSEEAAPSADDFDISFDETPAADIPVEETPVEEPAFEASIEDPVLDEPAVEATEETITEEASIDDFNTDLPSLKDETPAEEAPAESESAEDNFSLDDLDIPEPSVDESSIADIDIDEPDTEPKAEESFSLDEFDIPEPSVDESSIADIDIDEPASDIPSDEPATDTSAEDADFYANSDSPAISEEDISGIGIHENLEEPVLDDIDFSMDEPQSEDIDIPSGDSLVVDSSSTDFLEEDDPTLEEQLTSDKVDYLNEEAAVDDLGAMPEAESDLSLESPAVEGIEDSLEADTIATSEDETPADDMFASQWDDGTSTADITEESVSEAPVDEPAPSFDEESGEEIVHASTSFDDPVGFDIEDVSEPAVSEEPAEDTSLDAGISFDEPETDIPADEPSFEAPVSEASEGALDGDIKQEVKSVLKYMDQLLENLPEDKIAEFAQSEHFETYKKLFNELGLV